MGWGFRKSINVGPVRVNFSKRGVGASVGVKGLRVGRNAHGQNYFTAGLFGFFYRTFFGGRRK